MISLKGENTAAARSEIAMNIEVKVKGIIKGDILRSKSGLRKVGPESIRCIERNIIRKINIRNLPIINLTTLKNSRKKRLIH